MTITFKIEDGDVVPESTGQPVLVENAVKLSQDLDESLSTAVRQDNIGAGLDDLIGQIPTDQFSLRNTISQRVDASLEQMKDLQQRYHLRDRPAAERVRSVRSLTVVPFDDPTQRGKTDWAFRVEITTEATGQTVITGGTLV